jgi:hypothetical protein
MPKKKSLKRISDELAGFFTAIVDEARPNMLGAEPVDRKRFKTRAEAEAMQAIANQLGDTLRGAFGVKNVFDNLLLCRKIAGRYPWNPKVVGRAEHLHFTWLIFVNLCYLFEERMSLLIEECGLSYKRFRIAKRVDGSKIMRTLHKELQEPIRARGQHTHRGHPGHEKIVEYGMFDLLHRTGSWPKEWPAHVFFHRLTKLQLQADIEESARKVGAILIEFFSDHGPAIVTCMNKYNSLDKKLAAKRSGRRAVSALIAL